MKKLASLLIFGAVFSVLCGALQAADPNERDYRQRTLLMNAVRKGDAPRVKELLAQGADTSLVDSDKNTALYYAADLDKNAAEFVKLLLDAGANPNQECRNGRKALSRAKDPETIGLLAAKGADLNAVQDSHNKDKVLINAAKDGQQDLVKALAECGADLETQDKYGNTALLAVAEEGEDLAMVELLIGLGANVNAFDNKGRTALCLTADDSDKLGMAELLVSKGADVNARKNEKSWTPLALALREKEPAMAKFLIARGANVNLAVNGNYPVMFALAFDKEKLELTRLLLQQGGKLNVATPQGETPFMIRCGLQVSTPEELQWLISQGADPKGSSRDGRSALAYAAKHSRRMDVLKYLISLGVYDINAKDADGNTPILMFIINDQNSEALKQLIDLGCNPHVLNNKGNGLMVYAAIELAEAAREKSSEKPEKAEKGKLAWENAQATFKLLIGCKVNINSQANDGWTPLMRCLRMLAPLEAVQLMVEAGADPKITTPKGESALTLAKRWCKPDVVKYLEKII